VIEQSAEDSIPVIPEPTEHLDRELKRLKAEQLEQEEDPKDLEIQFLKERVAELENALKKTEQFKPATQIERRDEYGTDENKVFDWLGKREDKVSRYWFPNYGIELFRTRILSDLNNRGVKMFKRLYFEV
jgi:hypothetical protein